MKQQNLIWGLMVWCTLACGAASTASGGCGADADGDGICDVTDICPNTIPGAVVDLRGCPRIAPGDFDNDGDVDLEDFDALSACMTGPGSPASVTLPCPDADIDFDSDVDMEDVAAFNGCFSGAGVPADPECVPFVAILRGACLHIADTGASTNFALRLSPVVPTILIVDVGNDGSAEFAFIRSLFSCINVFARGGNDVVVIDDTFGAFTNTEITTLDGGSGHDTLHGGSGPETFVGGEGIDFVDGGPGADEASLGAGDDTFVWNPGDGNDVLEGQTGYDLLLFNGANVDESIFISGGPRLVFFRNLGNITIDGDDIEQVDFNAFGGQDIVFVDNLSGTDVIAVNIDLASSPDSGVGDGVADAVIVNGTLGADNVLVTGSGTSALVTGLSTAVHIEEAEIALDRLTVNPLADDDTVIASGLAAGVIKLTVNGGPGDDGIIGSRDADTINGEDDDDTIIGGPGGDTLLLGIGDDRSIWNPGDGSDLVEGELGTDRVEVNGGNGDEQFTVTANGARVRFDRVNPAPFSLDIGTCENLELNANGGNDSFSATGNLAALIQITVDGGTGDDTILGSNGIDMLLGGDDNDFIDGQQGNDVAFLGAGDDTFQWDPGDGSDTVEGQAGVDTLLFNGSGGAEIFDFSANGARLRFTRNLGNIVMDCDDVEQVDLNALGNTDTATVNDLTGTDVTTVNINLAGTIGGMAGDAAIDSVVVNGSGMGDSVGVLGGGTALAVTGRPRVNVAALDGTMDALTVNGLGGDDKLGAELLPAGVAILTLNGGLGNDSITGSGGADTINGDDDNDSIRGGPGGDTIFLGIGNDQSIWNPGDGSDFVDGELGTDRVEVNGGNGDEQFTVTANGARVRFDRINPAPFSLDIGTCENLVLNANGGNDSFSATGNLAALIQIAVDGGTGDDTILGSNGIDTLLGGDDNDFLDGQQGNDTALMGAGDDTFQWDPGDGSDTVDGENGLDTLLFNGSAGAEIFELLANGPRLLFTRNLGNIVMDCDDLEIVDLNALGNTDTVTVNDLAGTDVTEVNVELAGTIGGMAGDAAADVIIVNGTNGDDDIDVFGAGTSAAVIGLSAEVNVTNSEGANDSLVINTLGGDDVVTATTLPAGVIKLTVDGGANDDTLLGSQGVDTFLGGAGDDFIFGDNGNDVAFMGADADVFQWDPGDGNDTIEGQAGADTMLFFGSNAAEVINITPNGGRVLFLRDVANVTMDMDDVETIDFRALGGIDNIVIADLSGTDLTEIDLHLTGPNGGGDGAADMVTVNGTNGDDVFGAAGDAGGVNVFGVQAVVNIISAEAVNDLLTLNALGGDDVVNTSSLEADAIRLSMNGGLGEDILIGGDGNDMMNGGDGDDVALMGAGDDTFVWNPGDDNDTLEGQAGVDVLTFNGSNASEIIQMLANGGRMIMTRDVASVIMDCNDVERVDLQLLGGTDRLTVGDLSGTDVIDVNANLAGTLGGMVGDAAADSIIVNGTSGDDVVLVVGSAGGVSALGLSTRVDITTSEAANDRLTVNLLAGDDVLDASGLPAGIIQLTGDGGDDDDVLIGSDGADILLGGNGDDTLLGGPGIDVLDGGSGTNTIIQ